MFINKGKQNTYIISQLWIGTYQWSKRFDLNSYLHVIYLSHYTKLKLWLGSHGPLMGGVIISGYKTSIVSGKLWHQSGVFYFCLNNAYKITKLGERQIRTLWHNSGSVALWFVPFLQMSYRSTKRKVRMHYNEGYKQLYSLAQRLTPKRSVFRRWVKLTIFATVWMSLCLFC